jgi:hypothetical protein
LIWKTLLPNLLGMALALFSASAIHSTIVNSRE